MPTFLGTIELNHFYWGLARPLACAVLLASSALSMDVKAAETTLFRDLKYNAPLSAFGSQQGYYDCSDEVGLVARCVDRVKFLGHEFDTQMLMFIGNRLRGVELVTAFKPEPYASLMKALMQDFTLVMLQTSDRRLDLIEASQREGDSKLRARVSEIESIGLSSGELTYLFFEQPARALKVFPNSVDAMIKSPRTARRAEVIVREKDDEAWLSVRFSLPRLASEDLIKTPVPKEKF